MLTLHPVYAQELNCRVTVDYRQLGGTGFEFLEELEPAIQQYLNQENWTEDTFQQQERIDCELQLVLQEAPSLTQFRGQLTVASRRPIYGTPPTSTTTVVQLLDSNLDFTYAQGTPIIRDENRYDPLASVLDFYAFLILGYDYDTFSELGGTPFFEEAREISDLAQSEGAAGWSGVGQDKSRSALITQLLDPRFRPLRLIYHQYHYEGLDLFLQDPEAARANVLETFRTLEALTEQLARPYAIDHFFVAKYQEFTQIFEESALSSQAYGLLSTIDSAHLNTYDALVN